MRTRRVRCLIAAVAAAVAATGFGTAGATSPPAASSDAVIRYQWGTPGGSNYDPQQAFNQFANIYLYPAYDRLTELTPEGEVIPMLAESWEFAENDTVLRLVLRQGVVFHDGEPFNAEAVKANIERGQTLETSAVKPDLASIEEVVVVDEHTVELHLSSPGSSLPALLSDRAGMMISPAAFDNPDIDLMPVGAGPYQVVEHVPGSVISFERFPDYWNPEMQTLGGVEITMQLDPDARLRAVADGQADGTTLNPDQLSAAEDAGLTVQTRESAGAFLLFLNMASPGLDTLEVRQAISMAIDRQGLADALHAGLCTPTNQIFPSSYWAASPDVVTDSFDVEAARALLEEAGYGDGLALSAVVVNVPFYVAQLEALQAMLGEIGIDLEVTALEPTELLSRFSTGDADMYFTQYPGSVDPAKTVASIFAAQAALNPGHYSNADVDALALEGLSIVAQEERAPIYQELSAAAAADYFHIPICSPQGVFVLTDAVGNFTPTLSGSVDFRGVTLAGS
ncbi:ABC transporter substrate-binding protein [Desertimonas flava]|jgi:peptide/nickel transport system substrate-binding protein|uniref:ABC transporter substrate-binding protein n=1 Tax=Desertimonas flava TaxID=2064846 RepID=UPI0013C4975E|nr:ABC transporter substrate-binding protein [Desertimonas flava]